MLQGKINVSLFSAKPDFKQENWVNEKIKIVVR